MKNYSAIALILVCVAGFAVLPGCSGGAPEDGTDPDEAFLQEVRQEAARVDTASSTAGTMDPGNKVPKIEVETNQFDMGVIPNTGMAHAEMKVYNRGTSPLRITRVSTTCGCTTGKMREDVIQPGQFGMLEITVDPTRVPGFSTVKTLTLMNNDPVNPYPTIDVHTRVQPEIAMMPEAFSLGNLSQGEGSRQTMLVQQLQEEPFEIETVSLRSDSPHVEMSFIELPESEWQVEGKREYVITAKLLPEAPPGQYDDVAYIHSNLSRQPNLAILIDGNVYPSYRMTPSRVSVQDVLPNETYANVLTLSSDKPLDLVSFDSSNSNLKVTHRRGDEPNTIIFDLVVPERPSSRLQRDSWKLKLKSGDSEYDQSVDVAVVLKRDN